MASMSSIQKRIANDGKYYGTGGTGKNYVFNPTTGNAMVNGRVVKSTDKNYQTTLDAMKNDGFNFGGSSSSTTQTSKPKQSQSASTSNTPRPPQGVGANNTHNQQKQNKPYQTSQTNQNMYGNNTSTHILKPSGGLDPNDKRMTVDKYGNWVSDQFGKDDKGTYVLKGGNANNKVYMNDTNKQYFASNYGGTANFQYDDKNKTTYTDATKWRTDEKYDQFGDKGKLDPASQGKWQENTKKYTDMYNSMSKDEWNSYKQNASQLEQNFMHGIDGTMKQNENYNYAPVAFAPDGEQQNLQNMVYEYMRQNGGVGSYEGKDTLSANQALNDTGLGGMFNINQVTEPMLMELYAKMDAEANGETAEMHIDTKAIMDEFVKNGGLKEGYHYDPKTGSISVDQNYFQVGDILADKGEMTRWYDNQKEHMNQRVRNENLSGQMYETPLEMRAKHNPETLTPEMKQDLEMEREIKAQLEQIKLDLSFLDQLEAGGDGVPMVLGSGIGAGGGGMGGLGNNANQDMSGAYGAGGNNDFMWQQGGGRGAEYGVSQNYTKLDNKQLKAIAKRMRG